MPPANPLRLSVPEHIIGFQSIKWTLEILASFLRYDGLELSKDFQSSESIDLQGLELNSAFWEAVERKEIANLSSFLDDDMNIRSDSNAIDRLATAFFFLNCLWERDQHAKNDAKGRSNFSNSIWKKHGHDRPFLKVNRIFEELAELNGLPIPKVPSSAFLSHDIDTVYGAWKEDGFAAIKQGKPFSFVKMLWRHITSKPDWFNFRDIHRLESENGRSSAFFWIPRKGDIPTIGRNADYDLGGERILNELKWLAENGAENGLHKSLGESTVSEDMSLLKYTTNSCRYHFLRFQFDELINQTEEAELEIDCSLGYAEVFGYRNGYSLPFHPFNFKTMSATKFLEVPLTIMDGTFSMYKKMEATEAQKEIEIFLKEHAHNSVISILWHNSHFTNYKYRGYRGVYASILGTLNSIGIANVLPSQLIQEYGRFERSTVNF